MAQGFKSMQGFTIPFLPRSIGVFLCVGWFVAARHASTAQDFPSVPKANSSSAETSSKDSASSKPSAETSLPPASFIYLMGKNGTAVAVPYGATVQGYLDYLASRNKPVAAQNAAAVSKIEIEGTVDEDRANLKVTYTVRLQQADQFLSVPLFLNEAVLKQVSYGGDGDESPMERKDPDLGHVWWFRGRGPHVLELSIIVPLKKSRRLVLSLPPSPISRARIVVPHASITTKVIREQTIVETKSTADGKTLIDATDLGTRFELSWNPTVEVRPNEVLLESQTTIRAQIEPDFIQIRADQQVKSLQGQFGQFVVRLPANADSIRLDDPDKQTFSIDPKEKNLVTVTLKEKATTAQLFWTLRLPNKVLTAQNLEGFVIEGKGARKQVGRIGLAMAEGLRFSSEPHDNSVIRTNAGEFPSSLGPVNRAYQFLVQPFKLAMTVEEVKPYFQVNPQLHLIASAQQLVLDGKFEFRVERESVNEVALSWPDHKSEGWIIDSVDEPGVVEGFSVDDKGQIAVRLIKYQAETFALRVRAHRHLKAGDDVPITLPRPKSASRLTPSFIVLANFENVETELTARGETFMQPLPASFIDSMKLPMTLSGLKTFAFRVDTDDLSFNLRVTPQKRRIRTESHVEARWQDHQFDFVQNLIYEVSYERLSHIRVTVPASIDAERIRFFTSHNVELTPEFVATAPGTVRQIQLKLPEPQLGHFEVRAKYSMPFTKESAFVGDALVSLPVLGSADEPFSETRISLAQSDWFDAEPVSFDIWRVGPNQPETWDWVADGSPALLPLKLTHSTHTKGSGTVSHAMITAHIDGNGSGLVRAEFRVSTRSTSIAVVLPTTSLPAIFYWDDRRLADLRCVELRPESRQYSIDLSDEPDAARSNEHLLTIVYKDNFGSPFGWLTRMELQAPQLPKCLWYSQVIWQTILPSGQNLFTYPSTATPMFRWKRSGLFWSRKSDPVLDQLQESAFAGATWTRPTPEIIVPMGTANIYSFSQFGSPRTLVFETLSSGMVLFLGAGFSMVLGFVMFRLVILRHVMTILVLGMIVATIGLWYAAPLELLIQPMIAGLLFPITAVFLENWIRQRNEGPLMSFEGQGGFPPMQAFGSHFVPRQADPNDATVHRPISRDSQPSIPVEVGSGVS